MVITSFNKTLNMNVNNIQTGMELKIKNDLLVGLSNMWVISVKVMTIISLVVIPLLIIVSHYFIYDQARIVAYYDQDPTTKKLTLHYPADFGFALNVIAYLQIIVFIFILVVYPPYPAPSSIERYFKERGYRKAVDEYELIKRVLFVIIPLVLVFGIWSTEGIAKPILDNTTDFLPSEMTSPVRYFSDNINQDDLYVDYPALLLILVFAAAIFKMIFILIRKDFRLYYAKGCFVICQGENNEVKKMSYFTKGLNSYNNYLRRLISLEIRDLKTKIYSKIASSPTEKKAEIMNSIISSFLTDDDMKGNSLEPVRQLAKFTKQSISEFLTKQPFLNKLGEWSAIASVIVTMLVSFIPILLNI